MCHVRNMVNDEWTSLKKTGGGCLHRLLRLPSDITRNPLEHLKSHTDKEGVSAGIDPKKARIDCAAKMQARYWLRGEFSCEHIKKFYYDLGTCIVIVVRKPKIGDEYSRFTDAILNTDPDELVDDRAY